VLAFCPASSTTPSLVHEFHQALKDAGAFNTDDIFESLRKNHSVTELRPGQVAQDHPIGTSTTEVSNMIHGATRPLSVQSPHAPASIRLNRNSNPNDDGKREQSRPPSLGSTWPLNRTLQFMLSSSKLQPLPVAGATGTAGGIPVLTHTMRSLLAEGEDLQAVWPLVEYSSGSDPPVLQFAGFGMRPSLEAYDAKSINSPGSCSSSVVPRYNA